MNERKTRTNICLAMQIALALTMALALTLLAKAIELRFRTQATARHPNALKYHAQPNRHAKTKTPPPTQDPACHGGLDLGTRKLSAKLSEQTHSHGGPFHPRGQYRYFGQKHWTRTHPSMGASSRARQRRGCWRLHRGRPSGQISPRRLHLAHGPYRYLGGDTLPLPKLAL